MSARITTPPSEPVSTAFGGRYSTSGWPERRDLGLAYALLRIALGVNILMHGLVPIFSGIEAFASAMVMQFSTTFLPVVLVGAVGLAIPVVQTVIGALLVIGAFTRAALVAGELAIIGLTLGTSLLANAGQSVSLQLLYALVYAVLLALVRANAYSVDSLRARHREEERRVGETRVTTT
jgi:thiosulfate dehydrogenase [quinone] large subunit